METLRRLADRLDEAAAVFAGARPEVLDPAQPGADAVGTPGEVAAALRRQVAAALSARGQEAAGAGAALGESARARHTGSVQP
jgi:hypothetical protein